MTPRRYDYASPSAIQRARGLRRTATEPEALIWRRLRANAFGAKFRRQHPLDGYVLDFYCHEARLAIELDGGQHFDSEGMAHDVTRTQHLEAHGISVLRFTNSEVLQQLDLVLEAIWDELGRRLPSP